MQAHSLLALALLGILVVPGFTSGANLWISAGDSVTFVYDIHKITLTIVGSKIFNETTTQKNLFTLDVLYLNRTGTIDAFAYRETIPVFNSSTLSTARVGQNLSAVFNPYDNNTYTGKLGFYPFTYTNLPSGSVRNLNVTVALLNYPGFNGTIQVTSKVNATVTRDPRYIYVNCIVAYPEVKPFYMAMKYNATTGILYNMTVRASYLGTPQILTYQMSAYDHVAPTTTLLSYFTNPYVFAGIVVAVFAILVVYEAMHRKTGKAARAEHLKKRFKH